MSVKFTNELGSVSVAEQTLASIAGLALFECPGVAELPAKRTLESIVDLLGPGGIDKRVKIHCEDNNILADVHITIEYGANIAEVAEDVISKVKSKIEEHTGFQSVKVNVLVEGLKLES